MHFILGPGLSLVCKTRAQFFKSKSSRILDNGLDQILKMGFSKKKKNGLLNPDQFYPD